MPPCWLAAQSGGGIALTNNPNTWLTQTLKKPANDYLADSVGELMPSGGVG